jgi:hypothetical protein
MTRCLLLLLLAASYTASAVVIRHDAEDAEYQIPASAFPALADMPGEGHGVLIAPQWVVTVAHAVPSECEVTINGVPRKVEHVYMHPGYKKPPKALVNDAVASGDTSRLVEFLADSDDIALIKLASPIADVTPVALYRENDEVGEIVELIGKGATGNGVAGQAIHAAHRTRLRRAFNVVVGADSRWISYAFDAPPLGLSLEGITGNGDSGGPVIIDHRGQKQLAGLASFDRYYPQSSVRAFHAGLYGQVVNSIRISRYVTWIERVMSDTPQQEG